MKRAAEFDKCATGHDAPFKTLPEEADIVRNGVVGEREFPVPEWNRPMGLCGGVTSPAEMSYKQIKPQISSMCFTPDGMQLILCDENRDHPQLINVDRECKLQKTYMAGAYPLTHPNGVVMMDDSRVAVTGGGNHPNVTIIDLLDAAVAHVLRNPVHGEYAGGSTHSAIVNNAGELIYLVGDDEFSRLNKDTLRFEPLAGAVVDHNAQGCHHTVSRTMAYCAKNNIMYFMRMHSVHGAVILSDGTVHVHTLVAERSDERTHAIAVGPNGDIFVMWQRNTADVLECYDDVGGLHRSIDMAGLYNRVLAVDKFNHVWIAASTGSGARIIKEYF